MNTIHDLASTYIITYLNDTANTSLSLTDDEYADYDAEDKNYLAEIKIRNAHYDDCLVEYEKFAKNLLNASFANKMFLYVVATYSHIYVFNMSKLDKNGYDFRWTKKELPKNTHFGGKNSKKDKLIGYVRADQGRSFQWSNK